MLVLYRNLDLMWVPSQWLKTPEFALRIWETWSLLNDIRSVLAPWDSGYMGATVTRGWLMSLSHRCCFRCPPYILLWWLPWSPPWLHITMFTGAVCWLHHTEYGWQLWCQVSHPTWRASPHPRSVLQVSVSSDHNSLHQSKRQRGRVSRH